MVQLGNQLRRHQLLEGAPVGQFSSPSPTVMIRFSSISVGTSTFLGLLNLVVKAVAVVVSLYAGKDGKMGLVVVQLEEQEDVLYSRMAVVVLACISTDFTRYLLLSTSTNAYTIHKGVNISEERCSVETSTYFINH
ncbi:hypothetical protein H5410_028938 [Solanum commersonii]|uniref:Uncharacterized protein n=1 Tax=Solanum commersonii TaxID=4109 RepID=A0A9J5Z923_SOLCO|nr:hypothetical protein H5410_028938 [Solanum commersonii]